MLVSLKELIGLTIQATDGEIGKVNDAYFDDDAWVVRYLIDKTGFWLFGQQVLISPESVQSVDMAKGEIRVELTRDQVSNSPKVDKEKPLTRDAENSLINYWFGCHKHPLFFKKIAIFFVGDKSAEFPAPFRQI